MQNMEHVSTACPPSYHNPTGRYTELWSSVHANYHHHPAVHPHYSGLPAELEQHQQSHQLHEMSPVACTLNEMSAGGGVLSSSSRASITSSSDGSQWSGDSSSVVCEIGSLGKLNDIQSVQDWGHRPTAATADYTTIGIEPKDLTRLEVYQLSHSQAQNRLTMQTLTDSDQCSSNPARWANSKPTQLQCGERFPIADSASDAADALLSMKRATNTAIAKADGGGGGGTKGLCNYYHYEELNPSACAQCIKTDSSSRQNWDVLRYGRDTYTRNGFHPRYWGNQEPNNLFSSTGTSDQLLSTTKDLVPEPDDFRSLRHRATTDGHQTAAVHTNPMTVKPHHHWPSSPALNIREIPANSLYYTRSVGDSLSNGFTSAKWNMNAPAPLPKHQQQPLVATGGLGAAATPVDINHNKSNGAKASQNHRCHICGKSCNRPSSLRIHLRSHYGEKPFQCQLCGKNFSQAANLTAHIRIHSGEKPFKCIICNRSFSQSSSVKTHMRTHTGERPYPCTFCNKSFSDSSTLSNHRRTHTGEKPYQCRLCCRSFSQSGNLNRHLKIH